MTNSDMVFDNPSLLLIDDDDVFLTILSRILKNYPNQRFATSAKAGLKLARESKPDLILLDVNMPGLNGLEFCTQLKADLTLASIPVIVITSLAQIPIAVAGFNAGASDFITKPISTAKLLEAVRACLARSRIASTDGKLLETANASI